MTYPCYFAFGPGGGLQTNDVDAKRCLCIFTSERAVESFYEAIHRHLHGSAKGRLRAELDKIPDSKGLLERLELIEGPMAQDGIRHIVIDPLPGDRVICATILDFIKGLRGEGRN